MRKIQLYSIVTVLSLLFSLNILAQNVKLDKERLEWNFTSKVCIWKDNGQPFEVFFGNGMGVNFFFKSYKKATRSNKVEQIPYQQANEVINIFDTTKIEDEFK